MLPPKTGVGPDKQQWLPLGLKADQHGVKVAHQRALAVAAAKSAGTFNWNDLPWEDPKPVPEEPAPAVSTALTVGDALERLEEDFWKGKIRTSAAKRTWDRLKAEVDRLPLAATLTMDLLVAVGEKQEPGSRTRQEFLKVAKRTAKLVGIEGTERLDELKTPYIPAVRDVPSDEELADFLSDIDPMSPWAWPTWALVTFGCRPSETFSLVANGDGTARVLTVKRKGRPPEWRTALALPVSRRKEELVDDMRGGDWIVMDMGALGRSVPWDVKSPTEYDSATAKLHTDRWAGWLRRQHPTLQLYDLRHAWAIRSISKLPSTSLAAKCMGHKLTVHHDTYHRWLDQADIAAVAATLQQ